MTIFTIGYEGLDTETFVALLIDNDIETVVDVREAPRSRKPGFSRKSLQSLLELSGLAYVHMASLGCPKPIRDSYRFDGDWARYTKCFLRHLGTQQAAIAELSKLAATSRCALLCYEADFNFCHRSMVAEAVKGVSGNQIRHLIAIPVRKATPAGSRAVYA